MQTDKQRRGNWGEAIAVSFLLEKNYEIVMRNYRIREGEIDIIAWKNVSPFGKTLCFIEVKTRGTMDGSAERAVGQSKLSRMMKTAHIYCMRQGIEIDSTPIQFEQVSVYGRNKIYHYEIPID